MKEIFIIPAGGEMVVDIPGLNFYFKSSNIPAGRIRVQAERESFFIDEEMSAGAKLSYLPQVVDSWKIKNVEASAQEITLSIGLVYLEDNTISAETAIVSSVPLTVNMASSVPLTVNMDSSVPMASVTKTLARDYYSCSGSLDQSGGFRNPPGSLKNIHIEKIRIHTNSAVATNALTTVNRATVIEVVSPGVDKIVKFRTGSPESIAQVISVGTLFETFQIVSVNTSMYQKYTEFDFTDQPIILAPGEAINSTGVGIYDLVFEEVAI